MTSVRNLFDGLPERVTQALREAGERTDTLARIRGARIERIVSTGQASPPGFWYDQPETEWVVVLAGSAGLRFGGEDAARVLRAGDFCEIPARARHRVEWTDPDVPTLWLAIHVEAA